MAKNELYNLIVKRRSVRKFYQRKITSGILKKIINAARLAPAAANLQFLEYILVKDKKTVDRIFPHTKWAAYISPQGTPGVKERPIYYMAIVINHNRSLNPDLRDIGAAAENIILAALSFQIASCWLGAINKEKISLLLKLPPHAKLDSLIALGYPKENPRIIDSGKRIKYWRDKKGGHYVPKRPLNEILFLNNYGKRWA